MWCSVVPCVVVRCTVPPTLTTTTITDTTVTVTIHAGLPDCAAQRPVRPTLHHRQAAHSRRAAKAMADWSATALRRPTRAAQ